MLTSDRIAATRHPQLNLYPLASPEDRRKWVSNREDDAGLVRFVSESLSLGKNESDRKNRMLPPLETTRRDNPRK
jgi:hypothetical protein